MCDSTQMKPQTEILIYTAKAVGSALRSKPNFKLQKQKKSRHSSFSNHNVNPSELSIHWGLCTISSPLRQLLAAAVITYCNSCQMMEWLCGFVPWVSLSVLCQIEASSHCLVVEDALHCIDIRNSPQGAPLWLWQTDQLGKRCCPIIHPTCCSLCGLKCPWMHWGVSLPFDFFFFFFLFPLLYEFIKVMLRMNFFLLYFYCFR